jgi:uncharacterized lipoprotein YmbA
MRMLLISLSLLGLIACSSQPTAIYYYQLAVPVTPVANNSSLPALYIAPIRVAAYLNGTGLVMQQSEVEYVITRQHLWADALEQQLQRQLQHHLLQALPAQPLTVIQTQAQRQLYLEIDRFHADPAGMAVLSGRYRLVEQGAEINQPFNYQVALTADGYPAMVSALSAAWQQLLADVTLKLTTAG